jgi:hypothetical protein
LFIPDPRIRIPGSGSPDPDPRILTLTFYPSRIQGSKRHQIPDPNPQQCTISDFSPSSPKKNSISSPFLKPGTTTDDGGGCDEKTRKLSRQILDGLLPRLCAHSVQLSQPVHVRQLLQLLRALCPGALRPCGAIMSALLSCGVELASLDELTSWLAFTLITFLVVLRLSPEEAVLGRLQESAAHVMSCRLYSSVGYRVIFTT